MIKFDQCSEKKNIQIHQIDTDSFVSSTNSNGIFEDLQQLKDLFDFSNLNKNHKLFINKN